MGDIKVGDNYYNCDSPGGGLSQSQGNALDTNLKQFIINKKIIIYDSFSDSDKFDGYFIYKNIN
jgi:hypothetical protein